ncbi:hypothetical protein LPJ66_001357 [Kickxella alabastrina]|uniref:Uncharacterized protein n=1 Tax=Kickxella alabastrina TaxID=61397 RepID=A0ACC1ITM0_9FUNG|nr:hypothetical protein LPJ66_001357 [Kickxella alabastrina]
MNDSVTFFIALGLVFLVLRWLLGQGGHEQAQGGSTRMQRRLHVVRQEHLQTIQAMFPDIPEAAIRADLARTGSPVVTSDNILRNGGTLPLPAATPAEQQAEALGGAAANANVFARGQQTGVIAAAAGSSSTISSTGGVVLNAAQSPLVNRLQVSKDAGADPLAPAPPKVWESDSDKRSDILRKRKEFMLMEARKKYLEKQKQSQSPVSGLDSVSVPNRATAAEAEAGTTITATTHQPGTASSSGSPLDKQRAASTASGEKDTSL